MKNQVLEALESRRSIRSYTDQPVEAELLEAVLRAGTFAPTARNRQDPIIVAVQDPDTCNVLRKLNAACWNETVKDPYYGAPVILIVFAPDTFVGHLDAASVQTNMLNAAHAVGLGSCWINRPYEMFNTPEGKNLMAKWGIPAGYVGICSISLGHIAGNYPETKPRKDGYIIRV